MSEEIICKIDNIVKQFPGTTALDHVSFNVKRGEVHAIVGENGAGKSTLMNILSGVFPPTEGTVTFNGKECHFASPSEAEQAGIAMIHQELSLSPTMTAAENVYMNRMPVNKLGLVNYKKMYADCAALLEKLGVTIIDPAGQPFDPERHNAVMHVDDENLGENVVAQVFQKGFLLGDRVIRFATVQVAN